MLAFFKRRKYKAGVRLSMSYLLGLDTQGYTSHDVLRAYPNAWRALDADFQKGVAPIEAAASILTITFTDQIENQIPYGEYDRMERFIFEDEGAPKYAIERGIKVFIAQTSKQKEMGQISEITYTRMISEIIGALRGIEKNERSARVLVAPIIAAIKTHV